MKAKHAQYFTITEIDYNMKNKITIHKDELYIVFFFEVKLLYIVCVYYNCITLYSFIHNIN